MKAWPIDPLAFRDLKLEVSEKLPDQIKIVYLKGLATYAD